MENLLNFFILLLAFILEIILAALLFWGGVRFRGVKLMLLIPYVTLVAWGVFGASAALSTLSALTSALWGVLTFSLFTENKRVKKLLEESSSQEIEEKITEIKNKLQGLKEETPVIIKVFVPHGWFYHNLLLWMVREKKFIPKALQKALES